jgi:hypothetical protein
VDAYLHLGLRPERAAFDPHRGLCLVAQGSPKALERYPLGTTRRQTERCRGGPRGTWCCAAATSRRATARGGSSRGAGEVAAREGVPVSRCRKLLENSSFGNLLPIERGATQRAKEYLQAVERECDPHSHDQVLPLHSRPLLVERPGKQIGGGLVTLTWARR